MASFWLEFEQGGQVQKANFESSSMSLGRDRSSDFVLDHPTVSRQHALIVHQGGDVFQLVVLSRGGMTAIDGQQVQSSEARLYDGMAITLGKYTVTFRSNQAPKKPGGGQGGGQSYGAQAGQMGGQQGGGQAPMGSDGGLSSLGGDGGWNSALEQEAEAAEPPAPEEKEDGGAGIMSWDEIAATSEAEEEDDGNQTRADLARLRQSSKGKDDDESNPVVIIGALGAAAVLMLFTVLGGGGGGGGGAEGGESFDELPPLEVSVSCMDEVDCRDRARSEYEQGLDLLERRSVERGNLFEGYSRLIHAEAYLQEGGVDEIPSEMDQWQEKHDEARGALDDQFAEYRVRYHQAQSRQRHSEMADVLDDVETFFPERTARENIWARQNERQMKTEGIYPRR